MRSSLQDARIVSSSKRLALAWRTMEPNRKPLLGLKRVPGCTTSPSTHGIDAIKAIARTVMCLVDEVVRDGRDGCRRGRVSSILLDYMWVFLFAGRAQVAQIFGSRVCDSTLQHQSAKRGRCSHTRRGVTTLVFTRPEEVLKQCSHGVHTPHTVNMTRVNPPSVYSAARMVCYDRSTRQRAWCAS